MENKNNEMIPHLKTSSLRIEFEKPRGKEKEKKLLQLVAPMKLGEDKLISTYGVHKDQ